MLNRRDAILSAGAAALTLPLAAPAHAASLVSLNVTERSDLVRQRPGWPVPREPNQVMYMQRSMNPNTVVWVAQFDQSGNLASTPATVYWRKFNDGGERKGLTFLERTVGFGLNIKKNPEPGQYTISAKALPSFRFLLAQTGPGRAVAYCRVGGRTVVADHVFITMQGEMRATDMHVYGRDPRTGTYLTEHFRVDGGFLG